MSPAVVFVALVLAAQVPDPKLPRVRYTVPLAVNADFAGKLLLRGHKLDDVTAITCAETGVTLKPVGKGRKAAPPGSQSVQASGDTEIEVEITLPKTYRPATVPLVVSGPGGRAKAFLLAIDSPGTVAEKEPNNGFTTATPLTLPATVAGVIQGDRDVDVYSFTLAAGQTARVTTIGTKLGSPAELTLTAWDADRHIMAAPDGTGGPEPSVSFTAPRAGVYFVSVAELGDRGGAGFGYRLKVR